MPVIVSGSETDMQSLDFSNLAGGTFYDESDSAFKASIKAGYHSEFEGHDFQYKDNGAPSAGTIESFAWFHGDELQFNIGDLQISVEDVIAAAKTDTLTDDRALLRQMFRHADQFRGSHGEDVAFGFRGNDRLFGGGGNDDIDGDGGSDVLVGGRGADHLTGGSGADRFVFNAVGQSSGVHVDTVEDFSQEEQDKVDFRGIGGLHFIGDSPFHGKAGELRYHFTGGVTVAEGDVDGDGTADVVVGFTGRIHFRVGDFLL
jgi:Ca2+-binding RTX toxin-like protein